MKRPHFLSLVLSGLAAALLGGGCAQVPVWEQRLVAKPGMVFSGSVVQATQPALLGQLEPGRASAGGASAVGCSSCR
jgi:hypothetical protein